MLHSTVKFFGIITAKLYSFCICIIDSCSKPQFSYIVVAVKCLFVSFFTHNEILFLFSFSFLCIDTLTCRIHSLPHWHFWRLPAVRSGHLPPRPQSAHRNLRQPRAVCTPSSPPLLLRLHPKTSASSQRKGMSSSCRRDLVRQGPVPLSSLFRALHVQQAHPMPTSSTK